VQVGFGKDAFVSCWFACMKQCKAFPRMTWGLQATLDLTGYLSRLSLVWAGFFLLIGGPIAYQTFDPFDQVRTTFLA
jgi:hypothetical protein